MPDFGIFRGFNSKLFSDKLFAGQLPTQLGLIGSLDFGFDSDAQAFFDRVTTAGGTLSVTEKDAINKLVLDMKYYSIWSKMKAIYPMVGASSAACAQNLKSSSFTGTFSSGWTFTSTGATPNGTNAYMDTGLIPNQVFTDEKINVSNYVTNYTNGIVIGTTYSRLFDWRSFSLASCWNDNGVFISSILNGYTMINRNDVSNIQYKTNNNNFQTISQSGSIPSSTIITIGSFGTDFYSNGVFKFTHISSNLNETEASNLYTAVQAFQTTLSRQV